MGPVGLLLEVNIEIGVGIPCVGGRADVVFVGIVESVT